MQRYLIPWYSRSEWHKKKLDDSHGGARYEYVQLSCKKSMRARWTMDTLFFSTPSRRCALVCNTHATNRETLSQPSDGTHAQQTIAYICNDGRINDEINSPSRRQWDTVEVLPGKRGREGGGGIGRGGKMIGTGGERSGKGAKRMGRGPKQWGEELKEWDRTRKKNVRAKRRSLINAPRARPCPAPSRQCRGSARRSRPYLGGSSA